MQGRLEREKEKKRKIERLEGYKAAATSGIMHALATEACHVCRHAFTADSMRYCRSEGAKSVITLQDFKGGKKGYYWDKDEVRNAIPVSLAHHSLNCPSCGERIEWFTCFFCHQTFRGAPTKSVDTAQGSVVAFQPSSNHWTEASVLACDACAPREAWTWANESEADVRDLVRREIVREFEAAIKRANILRKWWLILQRGFEVERRAARAIRFRGVLG